MVHMNPDHLSSITNTSKTTLDNNDTQQSSPNLQPPPQVDDAIANGKQLKAMIKPTKKRFIVLFLFALNSANKAFQWIQVPASTKKLTYFYGTENFVINATSVLFMIAFVLLSIPSCYIVERLGIRNSILLGSFGSSVGALVKCFSCHEEGLIWLFVGQIIVSLSEQMIFQIPSRLASVWFPDHQVSSAVAICILGNQLGVALGFLVPEFVLQWAETKEQIGSGLYYIFLYTAILSILSLLADWWLFDDAPKYAPGEARLKQIEQERNRKEMNPTGFAGEMGYIFGKIRQLLGKKSFNLLCLSYGINVGLGYTIATILNQVLEPVWPDNDILVGNTGFIIILSGALASPLCGHLLDWGHQYKLINVYLTMATLMALILFGYVVSFMHSALAIYVAAGLVGAFQTGLVVAGLEYAVELTYPAPELVTASLLNIMPQIFGTVFVFSASYITDNYGELWTHAYYVGLLTVAVLMLLATRETLRRQKAIEHNKKDPAAAAATGQDVVVVVDSKALQ